MPAVQGFRYDSNQVINVAPLLVIEKKTPELYDKAATNFSRTIAV